MSEVQNSLYANQAHLGRGAVPGEALASVAGGQPDGEFVIGKSTESDGDTILSCPHGQQGRKSLFRR